MANTNVENEWNELLSYPDLYLFDITPKPTDGSILMISGNDDRIYKYNINDAKWKNVSKTMDDTDKAFLNETNKSQERIKSALQSSFSYGFTSYKTCEYNGCTLLFGGTTLNSEWQHQDNIYSLKHGESFKKLCVRMPIKLSGFGCCTVKQNDRTFILLFGGENKKGLFNAIWIYDPKYSYFARSVVVCPGRGPFEAAAVTDKNKDVLITVAYINDCYKDQRFDTLQVIPEYLMKCIACWYSHVFIHLFQVQTGRHHQISLSRIFDEYFIGNYKTPKSVDPFQWKEEMVGLANNRRYLRSARAEYVANITKIKQNEQFLKIGVYFACNTCDRIKASSQSIHQHFKNKHCNSDAKESKNTESGEWFLWTTIPENGNNVKCLRCKRLFASGSEAMVHSEREHKNTYLKLK